MCARIFMSERNLAIRICLKMASLFSKEDPYFLVYFSMDNSVHLLPKKRMIFDDDESELSVKVNFKTSNLHDDGTETLEDLPYDGKIIFSGSQIKCRSVQSRIKDEVNLAESSALNSLLEIAKEIKMCGGKRGASVRLKRVLAEESRDTVKRIKKDTQSGVTKKSEAPKAKSSLSLQKEIRLREAMAFAGISSQGKHEKPLEETSERTPQKNKKGTPGTPQKRTPSPRKNIVTPEKANAKTPVKQTSKPSPKRSPSPRKNIVTTEKANAKTPEKKTSKPPRKRTPSPRKNIETTEKANVKTPEKKTSKPPQKRSPVAKVKTTEKETSKTPGKKGTGRRSNNTSPEKRSIPEDTPTSTAISEGLNVLNSNEDYDIGFQVSHSSLSYDSFQDNIVPQPEDNTSYFSHHVQPEYGYNASVCSTSDNHNLQPLFNVIDYFQRLNHEHQTSVLGFLNELTSDMHSFIYGGANNSQYSSFNTPSNPSFSTSTPGPAAKLIQSTTENDLCHDGPELKERKVPLILDPDSIFKDITVNPAKLRSAEMRAMMTKTPAIFLLNKLSELLFSKEELQSSKGVKGLDSHRMAALQEYMHSRCANLGIEEVAPKVFMQTLQNKIGNLRYRRSGKKTTLTKKSD